MEDIENENESKRTKSRSPSPGIKSTAVVKYTAFQSPVGYARLQCNTDLNMPPSNWGAAIDSYGLKQILTRGTGLSSFRMAHMFPDCVGEVDVISGAECIKKLLKLPYQPNGTVSMMVHRVENTLLLDDFDVYDYLMKSEWSWLKDFFYENILKTMSEQEKSKLMLSPAPSSALQLTHKFLSHSVDDSQPLPHPHPHPHESMSIAGPYLPEPETREKPEEPPTEHLYNRNVLWTFEDIHMLIGSDLPIFGDKDRPCVSLRLRDAKEPINVLTGIDYWLDNLMCNVPEVLMCYHLDGIVQKYEPMKTEDLPNMENSKFSPKVIRNVAQNILSFLKSNATKAGHTYWLFKGPHDDVVKLYDLTSLCPDSLDNPFTTPVAMLLYRVARNMRMTNRSKHVKQLLEHVIELLKVERYPQIVASSHYMLADLYVPATTNPANPDFKDLNSDSDCEDGDFSDYSPHNDTDICEEPVDVTDTTTEEGADTERTDADNQTDDDKALAVQIRGLALKEIGDRVRDTVGAHKRHSVGSSVPCSAPHRCGRALQHALRGLEALHHVTIHKSKAHKRHSVGSSVPCSAPHRCGRALQHALRGLEALHHVTIHKSKEEERERLKQQIIIEEQHPKMANPFEPIKMSYEPITKNKHDKEHTSRSRRRKRERKTSDKTGNCLIESKSTIDKNAIQVLKDKKVYPTWHEPNRDDNFAWKLHLKTLLYEKICLAYATMAEYSYSDQEYGFSLKNIEIASKCQKLLCNMIIKSKVVDAGCLIGRVGDNYFQISKNWQHIDHYKRQFENDHELDGKIRMEIAYDMMEEVDNVTVDDFDIEVQLPTSELSAMQQACAVYRRAVAATRPRRAELLRRLASATNELAVRYMNDAQQIYMKYVEEPDQKDPKAKLLLKQFGITSRKSLECLDEATEIFNQVNDIPNLALLYCNKGRYLRFKAHCDHGGFSSDKRRLYSEAEELYQAALKLLGPRETCGACSVWELVAWELSCHLYNRAVLMQDSPEIYANEVSEVAEALKHALKYCLLSPGPRQYLYQFRAAMIYHRLGSLYHSQYRITKDEGPKRRTLLNATRSNYEQAANMFASLEDAGMYLTVQMEHVAVLETQAAVSPNLKLKSLQSAVQLLRQCHSIIKLLKDKDLDEQKDNPKTEDNSKTQDNAKTEKPDDDDKSKTNELNLLALFENRLHFTLKSIIQYCRSKSNKDYEKITDLFKKLYCASLKIKKNDDIRVYAASICEVLVSMDEISKEFE